MYNKTEKIFYYSVNHGPMITYYNFVSYMNEYTAAYTILEELKVRYPSADSINVYDKYGKLLSTYFRTSSNNEKGGNVCY